MLRRIIFILLCLSSLSFIPAIPMPARVVFGFLQAFYLPGFVFVLFFWDRESQALDDLFIPPLISPVVLSLFVVAIFMLTRSLETSVAVAVLILYCFLLIALAFKSTLHPAGATEAFPRRVVLVPLLFGGMVGALFMLNTYLLVRSDSLLHAPIVNEILDRGIPPLDPRLPHAHIRYMWFYHLFLASFVKLGNVSIYQALGIFNVINALVFPYLIARITAHYTKKLVHIFVAPILAIAGLSAASWILWPLGLLRALTGEVRGYAEIARKVGGIELNNADVIFTLTPRWTWMVSPMDRALSISPFNGAINLFLLCFLLVLAGDFQKRAPVRAALCVAFVMIATFLLHVIGGTTLLLTAFGAAILMILGRWLRNWDNLPLFQTVMVPAIALLAGLVCLPYFKSLTGGGKGILLGDYLHFGISNLLTIAAPMVGLFFIIRPLLKYLRSAKSAELRILLAWLIALLVITLFIDLPSVTDLKFNFLFFALLVVPVSIVLIDLIASLGTVRRIFAIVWVSVLFVVPMALTARGFLLDRPERDSLRNAYKPSPDRMRLYEWIRTETGDRSVVIELDTENLTPLYAHRHAFLLLPSHAEVQGFKGDEIERYGAIRREIYSAEPVPAGSLDFLRSLGLDFYVVIWAEDVQARPYLAGRFRSSESAFQQVYENRAGAIYSLKRPAPQ